MDVAAHFPARSLPVLRSGDVTVAGGSIAGVAAALTLARAGRRVVLVESRTYLGSDMTATLRPWLATSTDRGPFWGEMLRRLEIVDAGNEIALPMGALKLALEDLLLEAEVPLLYASTAVGMEPGVLVIGNKSGRQVIEAPHIVDATDTALVSRLAGGRFERRGAARYRRSLEFDGVRGVVERQFQVPPWLSIVDSKVETHAGYRGPAHVLVEFALDLPFDDGPDGYMAREVAGRHVGMALAAHLIANEQPFHDAVLGSASLELFGPQAPPLLEEQDPVPGLWPLAAWYGDPHGAAKSGCGLAAQIVGAGGAICNRQPRTAASVQAPHAMEGRADPVLDDGRDVGWRYEQRACGPESDCKSPLHLTEPEAPQRGRDYPRVSVLPQPLPTLAACDVLVVGGGTSGATATITAAGEGVETVLLDMNSGLGGTGTLGGVNSYWYGRHVGFSAGVQRRTEEEQGKLGYSRAPWNIEAKMYALVSDAERAGAHVYFRCVSIGALVEGNRVRGAVAATPWGPAAVRASMTIDATGDADIAAFAGVPTVYGAECDHTVMWFSLGQFTTPGRTRNNFTSMCDVTNIEDYTRAILAGRRRGSNVHDHGVYLAPRETRHIVGEVVMTHTDQLRRRHWPDTVTVHYSNHDVKGVSTSPWVRMGLIPPNLEIEIPYRMLLPRNLEGLIVAGKAISATHDALPAIRMQADMESLGGVAALAAVQAVRAGLEPRQIDVAELQDRLRREGVLPEGVPVEEPAEERPDLQGLVDAIDGTRPLYDYSNMEMGEIYEGTIPIVEAATAGPEIVPLLEGALRGAAGLRRIHLAQALAMHGERSSAPILIEEIGRLLQGGRLPQRDNTIRHAGYPPDQGAMPDLVYLLYSLGMLHDERALPVWERVAHLLEPTEAGVRDRRDGIFYYVEALAWSAEQLGHPGAIPMLQRLHSFSVLRDQAAREGFQPDFFLERQAMLELMLARALARCGAEEGIDVLIDYLDDARALLAEQAHHHLTAITGLDMGKDREAWKKALAEHSVEADLVLASDPGGHHGSDQ